MSDVAIAESGEGIDRSHGDEAAAPIYNIVGERVALGPLRRDLAATYQRWTSDFGVTRTMALPRPLTLEQTVADLDRLGADEHAVSFTVYERATGHPIGNASWIALDARNRTAEYIVFIAEADCRGRGYGTEATRLMLDYAFTALGLHSVLLTVAEHNHAGRRAYEKAGFRECGRRRQCRLLAGTLYDDISMDCLATEFTSPVLAEILAPGRDLGTEEP